MRAEQVFIASEEVENSCFIFLFLRAAWEKPWDRKRSFAESLNSGGRAPRGRGVFNNGGSRGTSSIPSPLTCTLLTFVSVNMVPPLFRLFLLPFGVQREADEPLLRVIFISRAELLERLHGGALLWAPPLLSGCLKCLAPGFSGHQSQALVQF